MAGLLTEYDGRTNQKLCNYVVDSDAEVLMLPTTTTKGTGIFADIPDFQILPPIGSTCVSGNNGNTKYWMLFTTGWQEL